MSPRPAAVVVLAAGAGLVLADAAIVVLALPELLGALDTTVEGVAAVVAVYTGVLALAALTGARILRAVSATRAAAAGAAVFALASLACASAGSLPAMLGFRAVQAAGGGLLLMAAFALLTTGPQGRRAWRTAALAGGAAGPAIGGALTQAFGWSAIFVAGVPVALAAAVAALRMPAESVPAAAGATADAGTQARSARLRAHAALALVSATFAAVLFGLVLLLVTGWSLEPLAAAGVLTIVPLAALAGRRVRVDASAQATAGAILAAGGMGAVAVIRGAPVGALVAPLAVLGLGLGMATAALGDRLVPERGLGDAARTVALRHAAITLILVALAPVIASQLAEATERTRERQVGVLLDAPIGPVEKLRLVPVLFRPAEGIDPRGETRRGFDRAIAGAEDPDALRRLRDRADAVLVGAVSETLRLPLLLLAGGALAAALLVPRRRLAAPALLAAVAVSAR
jgi:MFS family permease